MDYVDFGGVCSILEADNIVLDRAGLINSAEFSPKNRFRTRIRGFVIQDTVNNPIFPISYPPIDKGNGYLGRIFKQYIAKYQKQHNTNTLPWHFIIDYSKDQGYYTVHNTRPINLSFPYNKKELRQIIEMNGVSINEQTNELLDSDKEIKEMIHILIVGNSELDVYTKDLYRKIGNYIIAPISKQYKISPLIGEGTYFLNVGKKFKPNVLKNYIKRI